jgi:hypothetical protein
MERSHGTSLHLESPDRPPTRGGGLMKGAAVVLLAAAQLCGVAYFFGAGSSLRALLRAATPEDKRKLATELAKILTSQVELYKLQHNDALPDLRKYPNWEQLTRPTDRAGNLVDAAKPGAVGPYTKNVPKNPLNGMSTVAAVKGRVSPGDPVPGGRIVGFVYEIGKAGRFYPTDDSGTHVAGPPAPPAAK